MPRFFFPVVYDGFHCDDDRGEAFSTAREAGDHARTVAEELSRNNAKAVTVFLVGKDRARVIAFAGAGGAAGSRFEDRATYWPVDKRAGT